MTTASAIAIHCTASTRHAIATSTLNRNAGSKVDVSRASGSSRVSTQWVSRGSDERYLSLSDFHQSILNRGNRTRIVPPDQINVHAERNNSEQMSLILAGEDRPIVPNHWSFQQLAVMARVPPNYLRRLPTPVAIINLQYGLSTRPSEQIKTYELDEDRIELRPASESYCGASDLERAEAVRLITSSGPGDTSWEFSALGRFGTMSVSADTSCAGRA